MFKDDIEHSGAGSQNQVDRAHLSGSNSRIDQTALNQSTTAISNINKELNHSLKRIARAVKWLFDGLRPFANQTVKKTASSTAYLDGIRGFAAFLVYWQHHQGWAHVGGISNSIFENGFGFNDRYYFAALPGIRLMFVGGHFAVPIFFVLSGYVLSVKPLSYSDDSSKLAENLSSSLFRRWIRLHLPVIGTTFLYMTSWHLFGLWTSYPEHKPTYVEELSNWFADFWRFSFMFRHDDKPWPIYNVHLWSIPVEFKGSIVIYTTVMAIARLRRNIRLVVMVGLIFYFLYIVDAWYCAMFLSGMLLAELDQLSRQNNLPEFFNWRDTLTRNGTSLSYVLLLFSLYLGGVPSYGQDVDKFRSTPGWYYLSFLKPRITRDAKWFYQFWAATFFVACVRHIQWLRGFFEIRFNQYLGHVSFGLYLVHGPVLWIFGDRVYAAVGFQRESMNDGLRNWVGRFPISMAGPLGLELAFLVPQFFLLPLTLCLAQAVTKAFDEPSVRFAMGAHRWALKPRMVKQ